MNKFSVAAGCFFTLLASTAANLVQDADVNKQPLNKEFSFFGIREQGTVSAFEENLT